MSNEPPPINPAGFSCTECGHDISGTPVGGTCPECGNSVIESIRATLIYAQPNYTAANCLIIGMISLFTFGILSPIAIWLYFNARREMKDGNFSNSEHLQAIAGLLMGILSIPLFILIIML